MISLRIPIMPPASFMGSDLSSVEKVKCLWLEYISSKILDQMTGLAYAYINKTSKAPTQLTICYEQYKQLLYALWLGGDAVVGDKLFVAGCELSITISAFEHEPFVSGDANVDFMLLAQKEVYGDNNENNEANTV